MDSGQLTAVDLERGGLAEAAVSDPRILPGSYPPRTKEIIDPAYPLLEANRAAIESITRKTFNYGSMEAHKLDVYYPPDPQSQPSGTSSNERATPILVFFYGGGFVRGARSSPPSNLVHNNLGAFFASRGILTVIPDYRLVPSITYPQGAEDVRDALEWVVRHLSTQGDGTTRVFILAHSAGGLHVAEYLLTSFFSSSSAAHVVRGVAFMGVPYEISPSRAKFYAVAETYYGGREGITRGQPLSTLRRMAPSCIASLPPLRNLISGSEPRLISIAMRNFTKEFKRKGGVIEELVLEGHDHLSPILALSSGTGEEWGEDLVEWIRSH